jgi:NAD(P)-dependent dehydrogenase (short-subunit alcohol dehydrogenase family)
MAQTLAGSRVLVVGGSSGIGLAVAAMAAERGAQVTIAGRDEDKLAAAVELVGPTCNGRRIDTMDDASVTEFFASEQPFDHVVVTAAKPGGGPIRDLPMEEALALFSSKFWSSYRVARAAAVNDRGSITFVSGLAGRRPRPQRVIVGAACAALESMTQGLALELSPVRVNCVSPGITDTPLLRSGFPNGIEHLAELNPTGRVGEPDQIALQILACAENGFMTGAVIDLDGGRALT